MSSLKSMCLLLVSVMLSVNLQAAGDVEIQYIAIHYGNPANNVINESSFPAFSFYNAVGEVTGYTEEQKMIGNPTYLSGWYGKVPEKMAFSANYRGEYSKSEGFPYEKGAVYVLDKNGTVSYQLPPERFNQDNYRDKYDAIYNSIKSTIRKMSRGKEEKVLKEKKREYIKSSPVGELEAVKKSKTDNKVDGIVRWPIPDLELTDGDGNSVQLQELVDGKVTVLVFYTLNGPTWKRGDSDGNIIAEREGDPLMSDKAYQDNKGEEFNEKAEQGSVGGMLKMAVSESTASNDFFSAVKKAEELSDRDKAGAYKFFTQHLEMVQTIAK